MRKRHFMIMACLAGMAPVVAPAARASSYSVLYRFGSDPSGSYAPTSLVALPSGSLIGSALVGTGPISSVFFKLDPPTAPQTAWSYSIIYDETKPPCDAGYETAPGLLTDSAGNVYGRSSRLIFRLSPPALRTGAWTCTVLYSQPQQPGTQMSPERLTYLDHDARHLYGIGLYSKSTGSELNSGYREAMFRLDLPSPLAAGKLVTISGKITDSDYVGGHVADAVHTRDGTFFGVTSRDVLFSSGTGSRPAATIHNSIFQVTPAVGYAATSQLQTIGTPTDSDGTSVEPASISVDLSDRVVGVGYADTFFPHGVAFELLPPSAPGGAWQSKTIYSFKQNAFGGLDGSSPFRIVNHNGRFYGVTYDGGRFHGTLFTLSPPPPGSVTTEWAEQVVHDFGPGSTDGESPRALTSYTAPDGTFAFYGATEAAGGGGRNGTIFRYVP